MPPTESVQGNKFKTIDKMKAVIQRMDDGIRIEAVKIKTKEELGELIRQLSKFEIEDKSLELHKEFIEKGEVQNTHCVNDYDCVFVTM